jgi:hypothetical protein
MRYRKLGVQRRGLAERSPCDQAREEDGAARWEVSHRALEIVSTDLLRTLVPMEKAVRLLGVSISGFVDQENLSQISLL